MNSGATAPDWGSVDLTVLPTITVAKGGTNISSFAAGDILYATGATTLAKLAKGTTLQTYRRHRRLLFRIDGRGREGVSAGTSVRITDRGFDQANAIHRAAKNVRRRL